MWGRALRKDGASPWDKLGIGGAWGEIPEAHGFGIPGKNLVIFVWVSLPGER